jgi:hypothetical protein
MSGVLLLVLIVPVILYLLYRAPRDSRHTTRTRQQSEKITLSGCYYKSIPPRFLQPHPDGVTLDQDDS